MRTINVKEDTYNKFTDYIRKLVVGAGGVFISQDEALKTLLRECERLEKLLNKKS